ncbi:hypothetical protein OEZ60_13105 [Defluviimonas sp. WL0024]|uniref:Uncharacterized protein n=1 Tax=Albidovulum salinarum TaxID=2984153 RepID=A0ABT2X4S7_9RHOB|nr:hypothetical protein [Defluviimonas sp. WL0024]MCU9848943.1 hypothetical protein [Defluviimonas sp. WL0024]
MRKPTPSNDTPEPEEHKPKAEADKVPEWAENMEHTLWRLARAKDKERAKKPGLYR